jgi:hypothetical protein
MLTFTNLSETLCVFRETALRLRKTVQDLGETIHQSMRIANDPSEFGGDRRI